MVQQHGTLEIQGSKADAAECIIRELLAGTRGTFTGGDSRGPRTSSSVQPLRLKAQRPQQQMQGSDATGGSRATAHGLQ